MKKTYTWDIPVEMTIDFDTMYHNATYCLFSNEPDTFQEAIREEFACQDDFIYYGATEEIHKQVANDFRNYLIENNLSLKGMYDDEE